MEQNELIELGDWGFMDKYYGNKYSIDTLITRDRAQESEEDYYSRYVFNIYDHLDDGKFIAVKDKNSYDGFYYIVWGIK